MSFPENETTSFSQESSAGAQQPATDRRGLRVLGYQECLERLRAAPVGRLALVQAGEPLVFPVNHSMDGANVVFRTSWGSKLQTAQGAGTVAYEVDGYDSVTETGWSVMVKGTAEVVYEDEDTDRCDRLSLRSWAARDAGFWVRIRAVEVTGREILPPTA